MAKAIRQQAVTAERVAENTATTGKPQKPRSRKVVRCRETAATTSTSPRPKGGITTHQSLQTCHVRPSQSDLFRKPSFAFSEIEITEMQNRPPADSLAQPGLRLRL